MVQPHSALLLVDSYEEECEPEEETEEQQEKKAELLKFQSTVLAVFKTLIFDYRNPAISLTIGEIFSLCIGVKYIGANGLVKVVKGCQAHYQRVAEVVDKYCIPTSRNRHQYTLPPILTVQGQLG